MQEIDNRYMIFGSLFLISTRLEAIGTSYLDELTTKQWFFLAVLTTFFDRPPTISELARQMGSSHQNTKQIALKLEKKGFLQIEKDANDSRTNRLIVTEKSIRYGLSNKEKDEQFITELFNGFSNDEIVVFNQNLQKLNDTLNEMQKKYKGANNHE